MCGIFGEFFVDGSLTHEPAFIGLSNLNFRRGPDHGGHWKNGQCQLGMRRLAIVDLSAAGNQPMISKDGRWVMVYNGEVYNHPDIRAKLGLPDEDYHSTTDTEVILNAFMKWGVDRTVRELNGIFAIALYDKTANELYLVRDFAGIKPLYFGLSNEGIVFGSQFDQIFKHPKFSSHLEINQDALSDYLRLGYVPAPNALYKNTYQLEPGQVLHIDSKLQVKKYFYHRYEPGEGKLTDETAPELLDNFFDHFNKVIKRQLMADVSVGTFLSGGIDSPLVTAVAKKQSKDIATFTVGNADKNLDESELALAYAKHLQVKNHLFNYEESTLLNDVDEHFKAYSEPFGDYSSLPTFKISREAKKHFTVMLSGDGGDELFWGYPRFLNTVNHFNWFKFPVPVRKVLAKGVRVTGKEISYGINYKNIGDWVLEQQSHNKEAALESIFPALTTSDVTEELYHSNGNVKSKEELLMWLRHNEFYGHLQRVLIKVDRASMYNSLEVRVPFLDKEMLDFSLSIRPELGLKHNEPKYLLKKAILHEFPSEIVNKKKMGFGIPIAKWMRKELKEDIYGLLIEQDPFPHNTFDRGALKKYVDDFMIGTTEAFWGVWILYALQKWHQQFVLTPERESAMY